MNAIIGIDTVESLSLKLGLPKEQVVNELFNSLEFPRDKKMLAKLSLDLKMQWYSTRNPREMVYLGNDPEFQAFWKWQVVIPTKLKRFYYRVKNREVFKHYSHITEMKPKK